MSRNSWAKKELATLRRMYPTHRACDVAQILGRTTAAVHDRAKILGIKKSPAWFSIPESGVKNLTKGGSTRFRKGQVAWNKGKKGLMGPNRTSWKKGRKPHNTKYDGAISWRGGYRYKRIAEGQWEALHVIKWTKLRGKIPHGKVVVFKNHDPADCKIANLELVSRKELMKRNSIHRYPEEIKSAILHLGAYKRKLRKYAEKQTQRSA